VGSRVRGGSDYLGNQGIEGYEGVRGVGSSSKGFLMENTWGGPVEREGKKMQQNGPGVVSELM